MTTTVQTSCSSVSHATKEDPRLREACRPCPEETSPYHAMLSVTEKPKDNNGILFPVTNYNMKSLLLTIVMFLDKFQCIHWVNAV